MMIGLLIAMGIASLLGAVVLPWFLTRTAEGRSTWFAITTLFLFLKRYFTALAGIITGVAYQGITFFWNWLKIVIIPAFLSIARLIYRSTLAMALFYIGLAVTFWSQLNDLIVTFLTSNPLDFPPLPTWPSNAQGVLYILVNYMRVDLLITTAISCLTFYAALIMLRFQIRAFFFVLSLVRGR